jgi:nucleoside-diphosphate-sugar epimerase
MREGAAGCELAFPAAAFTAQWGAPEEFERSTVQGTSNALQACREAGVRRFVHIGTEAALMAGKPLVEVDESAPLRPDSPVLYCSSKARAERLVLDANGGGLETVVVRPRFVWGVGDTTILPELVKLARGGRFAWIGGGGHLTSTTHIENTLEGLILAAARGRPGNAYFVTDGEPARFREFIGALLATQGVTPPTRNIPAPLAELLAYGSEAVWKALRLPGEPPLTRLAYWLAAQECTIRIDKARRELGYEPVKTRAEGLAELAAGAG